MDFQSRFNSRPTFRKRRPHQQRFVQHHTMLEAGKGNTEIKYNANLDPGFEDFGERDDISVGGGAVVAHFASSAESDDPIVNDAVARGEYFQMPALELRAAQ